MEKVVLGARDDGCLCALFWEPKPSREDFAHTTVASMHHKEGCKARGEQDAARKWHSWDVQYCPYIERPDF